MIIVLKNADFSQSNIGTLSTWRISRSLGTGATYSGPTSVDKDAALSATVTLAEGYEIGTAGVTITMGGTVLSSAHSISGNVITITIASVTGNVLIKVPTVNTATGEEDEPDVPDVPPVTNYAFTINPTPSSATVTLTASGYTQTGNSITVPSDTRVSWRVTADGYLPQSGSHVVTSTYTKDVVLTAGDIGDLDVATNAFVTAASITDGTTILKLDTLVKSLKANNLWDKIEALYPCTGTSFEQMSYNLKDPTTYRLSCGGEVSITNNAAMSCSTHQIECVEKPTRTGDDFHLLGYSLNKRTEVVAGLLVPGPSNGSGQGTGVLCLAYDTLLMRTTLNDSWEATAVDGDGLLIGSLTSGIVYNGQDTKATKKGAPSVNKWHNDGFVINGFNDSSNGMDIIKSPFTTGLAGFGYGLTIDEMMTYSQILNEFKNIY